MQTRKLWQDDLATIFSKFGFYRRPGDVEIKGGGLCRQIMLLNKNIDCELQFYVTLI